MTHRDYSHRSLLDKLGIKPDQIVALHDAAGLLDADLVAEFRSRAPAEPGPHETLDMAIVAVDSETDIGGLLRAYRGRITPAGAIWLITPKRGRPGYIRGEDLIPIGLAERLVDNKVCSVSESLSGMRFVIRKKDRPELIRTIPT